MFYYETRYFFGLIFVHPFRLQDYYFVYNIIYLLLQYYYLDSTIAISIYLVAIYIYIE